MRMLRTVADAHMLSDLVSWISDHKDGRSVDPELILAKAEFIRNLIIEYKSALYQSNNSLLQEKFGHLIDSILPYLEMIKSINGNCIGDLNPKQCLAALNDMIQIDYSPVMQGDHLFGRLSSLLVLHACVIPESKYVNIDNNKLQILDFSFSKLCRESTRLMFVQKMNDDALIKGALKRARTSNHVHNHLSPGKRTAKGRRQYKAKILFLSLYPDKKIPHSYNNLYLRLAKQWVLQWPNDKVPVKNTILGYLKELGLIK
jgi:hypothetical protein